MGLAGDRVFHARDQLRGDTSELVGAWKTIVFQPRALDDHGSHADEGQRFVRRSAARQLFPVVKRLVANVLSGPAATQSALESPHERRRGPRLVAAGVAGPPVLRRAAVPVPAPPG